MNKKAIIAMSGGVDSSVAAKLTKDMGYDCMGITMKLYDNEDIGECSENTCCSLRDVEYARQVAYSLNMPYHVFNFTADFKKEVIDRFIEAYENGTTPNPCIDCNRYIKFKKLYERAKQIEFDYIVTGHYARIEGDPQANRFLLRKAVDDTKDQSYVLYSMTQEELAHTLFPLGELKKTQVRKIAEESGFSNAQKHDSQDICFVPDGNYANFIRDYTGTDYPNGNFIDENGGILGRHKGIIHYTIGQRKGLGLSLKKPMYVSSIQKKSNTVMLSEEKALFSKGFYAENINLISKDSIPDTIRLKVKIRYKQPEQWATVRQTDENTLYIEFESPVRAITKGQAAVLYDDDIVVGGGTIT